jgi:hypothetical protein
LSAALKQTPKSLKILKFKLGTGNGLEPIKNEIEEKIVP